MFVVLYIILVICIAIIAGNKNRSVIGWVLLGIILTPLVLLILLCLEKVNETAFISGKSEPIKLNDDKYKDCNLYGEPIKEIKKQKPIKMPPKSNAKNRY